MKKIVKLFLLILPIFLLNIEANAKTPTLCDRESLENYGVNKKWEITNTNRYNVMKAPCVDSSEKIYDFSGVLTDEEYRELKGKIDAYIEKTNMDLVIVIDNLPYSYDSKNEEYASDFYDYNDFGMMNDKYSGTLLFRNTYESDPYYNIYTFGDAQLYYDYVRLENILDNIFPDIREKRYLSGFTRYIEEIDSYYDSGKSLNDYKVDDRGYLQKKYQYPFLLVFLLSGAVTIVTMIILVSKNKMVKKETKAEQYLDRSNIEITKKEDVFLSTHTTSYTTSSSSGGGGSSGGGHSSSGSSGGGHSSGGGRHG